MEKTLNIVNSGGWVLQRIAKELEKNGWTVSTEPIKGFDIYYFVNYALARKFGKQDGINAGFFTHKDEEYLDNWTKSEKICDIGVYMADRYKPDCKITAKIFPTGLEVESRPLQIGVVGRLYANGRKGEQEIECLATVHKVKVLGDDSWKKIGITDITKWESDKQAGEWYKSIDVLYCASNLEGGPIPVMEAIKLGVPVIVGDIGNIEEWNELVYIGIEPKDRIRLLNDFALKNFKRNQLRKKGWDWFREEHIRLFENV
jgi:glycosyltransferase involved in cell wall biosynthesis